MSRRRPSRPRPDPLPPIAPIPEPAPKRNAGAALIGLAGAGAVVFDAFFSALFGALLGVASGAVAQTAPRDPAAAAIPGSPASAASAAPYDPAPGSGSGFGSAVTGPPLQLRRADGLEPAPRGSAADQRPILIRAQQSLWAVPDLEADASGSVELFRAGLRLRAEHLHYDVPRDEVTATGDVRIERAGSTFAGPSLKLRLDRLEGSFEAPVYRLAQSGAGGRASRIEFIDDQRVVAYDASYTSCFPADLADPAWVLTAERVRLDNAEGEGVADGARLTFYGVPLLALPRMSFPLSEVRKSGWLPPTFGLDSKSGLQASVPWYWDIAPNRDATIAPGLSTRRGAWVDSEFRYLEPNQVGSVRLNLMPNDRLTGTRRYSLGAEHDGDFGHDLRLRIRALRVSDDDYWKDFPAGAGAPATPRLLPTDIQLGKPLGDWDLYARAQLWQVLQTAEPATRIEAPYQRAPQIGTRYAGAIGGRGLEASVETEFNRFTNPDNASLLPRATGDRLHALGSIAWPWRTPGYTFTPQLAFNAASYRVDQPYGAAVPAASGSRLIPTVSVDNAWVFERDARLFGRAMRQTLEPRIFYSDTPYRDQSQLPNFDAYPRDFNFDSIYTANAFSGVDRVSDAHQVVAGVTSRYLDATSGAERLRLGIAQRLLLRDQRLTPEGQTLRQRASDVLLLASANPNDTWGFDSSMQYTPETGRVAQSVARVRYSPGPFRTLSATYRYTRGLTEQLELGWQWPVFGPVRSDDGTLPARDAAAASGTGRCRGTLYAVGRVNYSMMDRRLVDSVAGLEYDAGCWIGRVVATRQSTGLSEGTTRLLVQLELVGLSRLGTNPLQVLKDNVPGYRLLREAGAAPLDVSGPLD